jgi:hypothetical protein
VTVHTATPVASYAVVPRLWPGATMVLLGGGPSLTPADVDACRDRVRVIAINDAYRLAPWADVLYACDDQWFRWHRDVPGFAGLKYTIDPRAASRPRVQLLRNTGSTGLETDPSGLRTGANSGYQAINLAVHLGAARILLLGYDMQRRGGRDHWFGAHPNQTSPPFQLFRRQFGALVDPLAARGVTVLNCTPDSALDVFPCQPLATALAS